MIDAEALNAARVRAYGFWSRLLGIGGGLGHRVMMDFWIAVRLTRECEANESAWKQGYALLRHNGGPFRRRS